MTSSQPQQSIRVYETPSGRRWRGSPCRFHGDGCVLMTPSGPDTLGFGGVKARHVETARLDAGDRTWKPVAKTGKETGDV